MAIKIVEHSLKGAAAEIEGARESLLAASISHPNVVRCGRSCPANVLCRVLTQRSQSPVMLAA